MDYITIAMAKGRLAEKAMDMLEEAGIDCTQLKLQTRRLVLKDDSSGIRFVMVKPVDVPTYVEYGAADMGIVGKDVLMEEEVDCYEMLDLGFGHCKMVVAGPREITGRYFVDKRVATKYPRIAERYFKGKGENVEIIKLNGSVELAPILGLSEVIVDIVETGRTLKENGLVVLDEIFSSSARLIVNKASLKVKSQPMREIISRLREVVE
ncbi:ATP phosphoribosyltransferase [Caldanaerobius polysaccharolyticus]|uniref:ATP phosphoribosyltransferase n=1 Tax=Caldanaerobius polysaccharolyticus TaxID=44256 RepID=UPI00047D6D03|nr:ATP phosphoribosyltransferase [Caldanaerobius polysaccharolyticus]